MRSGFGVSAAPRSGVAEPSTEIAHCHVQTAMEVAAHQPRPPQNYPHRHLLCDSAPLRS